MEFIEKLLSIAFGSLENGADSNAVITLFAMATITIVGIAGLNCIYKVMKTATERAMKSEELKASIPCLAREPLIDRYYELKVLIEREQAKKHPNKVKLERLNLKLINVSDELKRINILPSDTKKKKKNNP